MVTAEHLFRRLRAAPFAYGRRVYTAREPNTPSQGMEMDAAAPDFQARYVRQIGRSSNFAPTWIGFGVAGRLERETADDGAGTDEGRWPSAKKQ